MTTILRKFFGWAWVPLVVTAVVGCAGKTSVNSTHPLIVDGSAGLSARVYFIRRDHGFRGVMDMPLTIKLGGTELLKLAKGQYTLVTLEYGTFEVTIDSFTVESGALTPESSRWVLTLSPQRTNYFLFEPAPRPFAATTGPSGTRFVPIGVLRDKAFEAVRGLTPVGLAIDEPILQP